MRPTAFRIHDFKSITDSGVCSFSGDGITVLAGQNESGKTAILTALRDFDLPEGKKPVTPDYWPDDADTEVRPRVSVRFSFNVDEITAALKENSLALPEAVLAELTRAGELWITRDLESGKYELEERIAALWPQSQPPADDEATSESEENSDTAQGDLVINLDQHVSDESGNPEVVLSIVSHQRLGNALRPEWPQFVYFDSFGNILPRDVLFSDLQPEKAAKTAQAQASTTAQDSKKAPQPVLDFLTLSGIELERVEAVAKEDKRLDNYLSQKSASITGDFLTYWKQTVDCSQKVWPSALAHAVK